jgi:hypothetical protein
MRRPHSGRRRLSIGLSCASACLAAFAAGCERGENPQVEPEPSVSVDSTRTPAPAPGDVVFDRDILFLSLDPDSLLAIPWSFRSRVTSTVVEREQKVLLGGGGTWEVLAQESRSTPPTRSPWRIIPGTKTGIVVGPDDRLESLILHDPPRELEVVVGDLMTEWPRPGDEAINLYRGRTEFPAGPTEGLVLEISRRWEASAEGGGAPGDWLFLHSGTQLQLFLDEREPGDSIRSPARYGGWSRLALRDLGWENVTMEWPEMRAFDEARRDVPAGWHFSTARGDLSGTLTAVDSHLEAGTGEGPILPVSGYFEVSGDLEIQGERFDVVGIVRHVDP